MALLNMKVYNNEGIKISEGKFNTDDSFNDLEMLEQQTLQGNIVIVGDVEERFFVVRKEKISLDHQETLSELDGEPMHLKIVGEGDLDETEEEVAKEFLYSNIENEGIMKKIANNIFFNKKGEELKFDYMFAPGIGLMKWNYKKDKWKRVKQIEKK